MAMTQAATPGKDSSLGDWPPGRWGSLTAWTAGQAVQVRSSETVTMLAPGDELDGVKDLGQLAWPVDQVDELGGRRRAGSPLCLAVAAGGGESGTQSEVGGDARVS
jgi:hypothetical protein